MPCLQLRPIGFIVLCESIRNGRICRRQVQRLRASVNHRMVQSVRPAAKIFTDFTSIVFGAAKLSRHVRLGTEKPLVYASVRRLCVPAADSAADFTLCREMLHGAHK